MFPQSGEESVSKVIDFLERFGSDSALRHAPEAEIAAALRLAGLDPAVRAAIVNNDQRSLEELLGADTNVCCVVNKPDDEEEEEEEEDEEPDEDAEETNSLITRKRAVERVA
jgi:hypothetical protein